MNDPSRAARSTWRRLTLLAVFLAVAGLLAAACGSDDGDSDAASDTATPATEAPSSKSPAGFPVTLKADNGPVTIDAAPTRIVSLSPTATEMLFAIGAGGLVAAVDDQSNYPPEAPMTDLSGFSPNLEAIVGMAPDLVVVQSAPPDILDGLNAAGVPVLALGAVSDLQGSYDQIGLLGQATGQTGGAEKLVGAMQDDIDAIVEGLADRPVPLTYYHELDDQLYSVTSKTFIGSIYSMVGLTNIADIADTNGSGYPQLSAELLVQADPDLIFLADTKCCNQNAASVAARPGWSALRAVQNGSVIELDDDVASRWGPRVVDQLQTVAAAVNKVPVVAR